MSQERDRGETQRKRGWEERGKTHKKENDREGHEKREKGYMRERKKRDA